MRIATALWTLAAMAAIESHCPAAAPDVRQGRGLAAPDEKPVLVAAELPPTEIADVAAAAPQTERALGVKAPRAGGAEARPGEGGPPTRLA
ncbi:MAG TPA: hypothetical protein VEQ85_10435, partial [Lacipirellulaceae bacterium]|nr:hypothetical protein [Lacipirellulaceae bacterium]